MSQDNDETMLDSTPKGPHKSVLKAGDRLGDYVLMRMLGAGAMGQVYLGRQVHLNQTCAIKVLPEELSRSTDFTKRFASEGQALARMDNSSIVRVLNASVDSGRHFMVLEFVDGGDLADYIHKKGGKLDEAESYDVLTQILDGLAYAHKKGIVHRDLKPANILRTSDGKFKISDFGLALVMDSGFVQDLVRKSIVAEKPVDAANDATVYGGAKGASSPAGRAPAKPFDPDATMVQGPSPTPQAAFDPDATMVAGPAPSAKGGFDPDATMVSGPGPAASPAFDPDATMVQGPAPSRPMKAAFDPDATMVAGPAPTAKPAFDPDATMVAGPSAPAAGGGDETVVAPRASATVPRTDAVNNAGTVHSTADISGASAIVGTLDYMSPEVRAGQPASARSDIYAIGIMAYQMLTGRKPLGRAKAVSVLRPGLSPTWDEWIDKCLEVELTERFQSAGDALEALKKVRVGSVAQDAEAAAPGASTATSSAAVKAAPSVSAPAASAATAASVPGTGTATPAPKKGSKTPLVIAGVVLILVACGIGVAVNLHKNNGGQGGGVAASPTREDDSPRADNSRAASRPDERTSNTSPASDSRGNDRANTSSQNQSPASDRGESRPNRSSVNDERRSSREEPVSRPTTPAPEVGRILLGDLPSGTLLGVDGGTPAPAPSVLNDLSAGKHVLRFTRTGYDPVESIVKVAAGDVSQLGKLHFVRQTGSVKLDSASPLSWRITDKPADADSVAVQGTTPATLSNLPTGNYTIEFSPEGAKSFTKSVTVSAGAAQTLSASVPGGSLSVRANVEGASVTDASGKVLGRTPLVLPYAASGNYLLTVSADGYSSTTVRGKLADGGKLELSAYLEKAAAPSEGRATGVQVAAGIVLPMEWIAPGSFRMGSDNGEIGREAAETPHNVTISSGFWMGRTEVTQAQWTAVMGTKPSGFSDAGPDAPVEKVSYDEALDFCRRLTEIARKANVLPAGYEFTLPTEAQWEYACRAGSAGSFEGEAANVSWSASNSGRKTHAVAQKAANAFGLFDMHGNVAEWCLDWYGPYPQADASDPAGPSSGQFRVARGGSWQQGSSKCRSAARNSFVPTDRWNYLGLRVVLTKSAR